MVFWNNFVSSLSFIFKKNLMKAFLQENTKQNPRLLITRELILLLVFRIIWWWNVLKRRVLREWNQSACWDFFSTEIFALFYYRNICLILLFLLFYFIIEIFALFYPFIFKSIFLSQPLRRYVKLQFVNNNNKLLTQSQYQLSQRVQQFETNLRIIVLTNPFENHNNINCND